jgi:dihydrofolate reductase
VRISLLAAMDEAGGIGRDGKVPWHLGADLALFKRMTMGHHVLMGRKTFASIGRDLPGRRMIVLSRDQDYAPPGVSIARSLDQAVALAENEGENELYIVGGGEVYAQSIGYAQRIYLTRVRTLAGCQVFFPLFEKREWLLLEAGYHPQDPRNEHAFEFNRLEKSPARSS